MIKSVKVNQAIKIFKINSKNKRDKVNEITLDMAYVMVNILTKPNKLPTVFMYKKLVYEANPNIRIKYRLETLELASKS
jgi:hypothetical protein